MSRAATLFALGCSMFACARRDSVHTSVPDDVMFAAILGVDANGGLVESTPILEWGAGHALPVYSGSEERVFVSGWTEAQLRSAGTAQVVGAGVQKPDGAECAPRLPVPVWLGELGDEGTVVTVATELAPELASPDLAFCPSEPKIEAWLDCTAGCIPRVTALGGCRFELDFGACDLGHANVNVGPSGETCLATVESDAWTCSTLPPSGRFGAGVCDTPIGRCQVTVGVVDEGPPFLLDELDFAPGAPLYVPERTRDFGAIDPHHLKTGWAYDMVVLDREVVVSTTGDEAVLSCPQQGGELGVLVRLDTETKRVIGTSTVPTCLTEIRADPDGPDFIGVYFEDRSFWLGRFLRDGTITDRAELVATDGAIHTQLTSYVVSIENLGAQIFVVVGGQLNGPDRLYVFEQGSLDPVYDEPLPAAGITTALKLNALSILFGGTDGLTWYDVTEHTVQRTQRIEFDIIAREYGIYGMSNYEETIYVLSGPPEQLLIGDFSGELTPLKSPTGVPTRVVWWPLEAPSSRLVFSSRFGANEGDIDAVVTSFEASDRRFRPGVWTIGEGVASRLQAGVDNRLYVLLPWAGKVARLTPR